MDFDLPPNEQAALIKLLRDTIAGDRFPLSPHIRLLQAILDKLDPAPEASTPFPPPKPPGERSLAARKRTGRR